jgi:hypothetical protein
MSVAGPQPAVTALKPRWYRHTPDRFVIGLLVVECPLWFSERFQCFPFSRHKGWMVLIAVAGVGVVLLLMLAWFLAALIFRPRFQFGIRTLLVLTVAVALPFSWLAVEMKNAREQWEAVEAVRKLDSVNEAPMDFWPSLGTGVRFDWQVDPSGNPQRTADFGLVPGNIAYEEPLIRPAWL